MRSEGRDSRGIRFSTQPYYSVYCTLVAKEEARLPSGMVPSVPRLFVGWKRKIGREGGICDSFSGAGGQVVVTGEGGKRGKWK